MLILGMLLICNAIIQRVKYVWNFIFFPSNSYKSKQGNYRFQLIIVSILNGQVSIVLLTIIHKLFHYKYFNHVKFLFFFALIVINLIRFRLRYIVVINCRKTFSMITNCNKNRLHDLKCVLYHIIIYRFVTNTPNVKKKKDPATLELHCTFKGIHVLHYAFTLYWHILPLDVPHFLYL